MRTTSAAILPSAFAAARPPNPPPTMTTRGTRSAMGAHDHDAAGWTVPNSAWHLESERHHGVLERGFRANDVPHRNEKPSVRRGSSEKGRRRRVVGTVERAANAGVSRAGARRRIGPTDIAARKPL